ncbi:MAG TPA: PAS sensor protein [Syntrophaceae bacterium]|jgi:PAS domain S-box-containing protein|nr:PAS domain S-box protein [Smithellaceae bacterium]HBJ74358.1 PAS sensor protein [Syntrophaceae bacterium]HCS76405.1 PAS sensor protein [Syntrophaceae bacterium]HCX02010.1 PAS sensor protein [Syntrophaceae bacterium]
MSDVMHILIVEDMPTDAELCEREVRQVLPISEFRCVETEEDFLNALDAFQPDLILSDYSMPRFDGMTALLLARARTPETPFVILTGSMNEETAVACMKAGAWDYVIKEHIRRLGSAVLVALEQKKVREERRMTAAALQESEERMRDLVFSIADWVWEVDRNCVYTYSSQQGSDLLGVSSEDIIGKTPFDFMPPDEAKKVRAIFSEIMANKAVIKDLENWNIRKSGEKICLLTNGLPVLDKAGNLKGYRGVDKNITERKKIEERLQQSLESLQKATSTTIQVMVSTIEVRDPYTSGHQIRSAGLAVAIAGEMGLPQEKIDGIHLAGSIHDIGKLSIPAEILSKPTKLTKLEFSLIQEHAQQGFEILKNVQSPWPLAEIVRQHHERMDGSGYPRNLKGDDILIEARILAVADTVEAMASHRPYRAGLGIDKALEEIEKQRGILYDEAVADACLRLFREKGYQLDGK